eukprot:gnl/MRDRNA2_/MRDRNA2_82844_c1_seq1.p1 gnl/MRDRNA2_/MRDRNA2_82844_c1~~gnl/MRDRNA2_/MRDRNA2_82844_c1_seq1.p1  ORF type:complete len:167 (+),score=26.65 gnl/MRDRNA2_/MRDRNA2_82844_c1_seq1:61-501(+)
MSDAVLTYGDGSTMDGTQEYGKLSYTKMLPHDNRKYKVTVVQGSVHDFKSEEEMSARPAMDSDYSFYVRLGSAKIHDPSDVEGPTVVVGPPPHATPLPKTSIITLEFNEDIQAGSGTVSFCTNSDAGKVVHGVVTGCNTGALENGA